MNIKEQWSDSEKMKGIAKKVSKLIGKKVTYKSGYNDGFDGFMLSTGFLSLRGITYFHTINDVLIHSEKDLELAKKLVKTLRQFNIGSNNVTITKCYKK